VREQEPTLVLGWHGVVVLGVGGNRHMHQEEQIDDAGEGSRIKHWEQVGTAGGCAGEDSRSNCHQLVTGWFFWEREQEPT
jgi:hypothetical protein